MRKDCSLEAEIVACTLKLQPGGSDCSPEAQIAGWRVQIAAWTLRLQPGGADCSLQAQKAKQPLVVCAGLYPIVLAFGIRHPLPLAAGNKLTRSLWHRSLTCWLAGY